MTGLLMIQTAVAPWVFLAGAASIGAAATLLSGDFFVGLGVTFGSGCTLGHGVCRMARLSPRSIVATLIFMLATFIQTTTAKRSATAT